MEIISLWISQQIVLPPALISSAGIWSVRGDLWLFSFSIANSSSEAIGSGTSGSAVCMSVCLTSLIPCTFNLGEIVPPPSQNTVGVCNQITYVILHYSSSRLVTLLKVIDAPIQVPNIFYLIVSFKFLNCSFQICLLFVPEMSASFTSYIVLIIDIALAWIMYPLHFSLLPLI